MSNNTVFLLSYSISFALFDLVICYFVINSLLGNTVIKALKAITGKEWRFACCCFFILTMAHFLSISFYVIRPFSFIVTFISLLSFTKIIVIKNKMRHTSDEIILMFFTSFILSQLVVISTIIPKMFLIEAMPLGFLIPLIFLTSVFLLILNRIHLNPFFVYVVRRLALKITIFIVILIILLSSMFIGIHFSLSLFSTLIPIGILLSLCIFGLWQSLKIAYQFEVVMPARYQQMKKILTLLNLKMTDAQTTEELKEIIETTVELIGIKVAEPTPKIQENEQTDFEMLIKHHVETLKLNYQANAEIHMNIRYFEAHKKINALDINYMVSMLLENAFETETTLPIKIDLLSTEHVLLIKIANETALKTAQELENMLVKGYSTKGAVGRGFGLSKLKKFVEKQGGTMTISQEINVYQHAQESYTDRANYICFTLHF